MYRIRKGSLTENLYLKRDGTWGEWKTAAKFKTQDAATKFAEKHNIEGYGLFTQPCVLNPKAKNKPMPEKNYWYNELQSYTDVELRSSGTNSYYVATINGVEGVVGHNQRDEQKALDVMVNDTAMRKKKYTCKIKHPKISHDWMYFKTPEAVGEFLRTTYPRVKDIETAMIVKVDKPTAIPNGSGFNAVQPDPFGEE